MSSWKWGQPQNGIIQVAHVVVDIHSAMTHRSRELGVGPWFLFEHFQFKWLKYRGKPVELDITLALACSGPMIVEVIQVHGSNSSVYERVRSQGGGFHHWAIGVRPDQYESHLRAYEARGYPIELEGAVAIGARAAYIDTTGDLGGMLEIIEVTPQVEDLFAMVHQSSIDWNGEQPVRVLVPPG